MGSEFLETTVGKFSFKVRPDRLYTEAGLWVAYQEDRGTARVGLTDYRQQSSGDAAFVDLPAAGTAVKAGEEMARVETVKVDLEVPAPFDGEVVATNAALPEQPELINEDPYGEGWLAELRPATWPVPGLLAAPAYLTIMQRQAEAGVGE